MPIAVAIFVSTVLGCNYVTYSQEELSRWNTINRVNRFVNHTIQYQSDLDQYGSIEKWTIPSSGKGDCEDFALMKQDLLKKYFGIASNIARVKTKGRGHAVLLVGVKNDIYVLDNIDDVVWRKKQLTFYKWE